MQLKKILLLLPLTFALLSGCTDDSSAPQPKSEDISESATVDTPSDEGSITDLTTEETSEPAESSVDEVSSETLPPSNNEQTSEALDSDGLIISFGWPNATLNSYAHAINDALILPQLEIEREIHHGVGDGVYVLEIVTSDVSDLDVIAPQFAESDYEVTLFEDSVYAGLSNSSSYYQFYYYRESLKYPSGYIEVTFFIGNW